MYSTRHVYITVYAVDAMRNVPGLYRYSVTDPIPAMTAKHPYMIKRTWRQNVSDTLS